MTGRLSVSVVVCTATLERETLLRACVKSLLAGTRVPDEIFLVVDHRPELEEKLAGSLPATVTVLASDCPGLSGGRNVGARVAASDVVAFVDDDARVEPDWLSSLMETFEASDDVLGAGGAVLPEWGSDRRWLPDELLWLVGCTYRGHLAVAGPIRNPIGCNMAFRRRELMALGGFATEFGRRRNIYCDETELSLRLERTYGPGRIRYVPAARVRHFVSPARISWQQLVRRSVSEGLAKGTLDRLYGRQALGRERSYVRSLVAETVPRLFLAGIAKRDGNALLGAGAILVSLLVTGAAFVVGVAATGARHRPLERTGAVAT
jgi:GT2 family glycosyltransferase